MLPAAATPSKPALSLALSFLFLGVGYAIPFTLTPHAPTDIWHGQIAPEALNLYSLVAWMGQAHFFYATRGQGLALKATGKLGEFFLWLALAILGLLTLRFAVGVALFSVATFLYFIYHFIKAERFFSPHNLSQTGVLYLQPVVAFAWLNVVLFAPGLLQYSLLMFLTPVGLALIFLFFGGWRLLSSGETNLPMLTFVLLAECLVWTGYGKYMHPEFRIGVYIFHIAAASYYHYFSSYFFAGSRRHARWLSLGGVVAINAAFIATGFCAAHFAPFRWLTPFLGVEWFTFWVALHLVGSDLFPIFKKLRVPKVAPAAATS